MRQILWGFFKKMVIADNCAIYVSVIFNDYTSYSSSTLCLGAILFAFQIYGDFSGYSDIAIGTSKLFGFNLKQNFATPYFSRDIGEFWRRWHISLSTWFRDYLYIPLGGSKVNTGVKIRNTFIIFIVSGFWHGANWTFIAWGALNALYFLPLLLSNKNRKNLNTVVEHTYFPSIKEFFQIVFTFSIICLAWIFFRAENIHQTINYIDLIFSKTILNPLDITPYALLFLIPFFIIIDWIGRNQPYALATFLTQHKKSIRWSFYEFVLF